MQDVDDFLKKYRAQASLHPHKEYMEPQVPRLHDWTNVTASMSLVDHVRLRYVEMLIPQREFQTLVEQDRYWTKMSRQHDYAVQVVNQMVADEVVRKNNPTVERAWRNYQLLLEMSRK